MAECGGRDGGFAGGVDAGLRGDVRRGGGMAGGLRSLGLSSLSSDAPLFGGILIALLDLVGCFV